jgi:hypothetical protein
MPVSLVVDTGADRTLIAPVYYETQGVRYGQLPGRVDTCSGYGGIVEVKAVDTTLYLRHDDGRYVRLTLEVEFGKPSPAFEGLPSVLGRDVLDLFRLVIDRSAGLVCLDTPSREAKTDPALRS